MKLLPYSILILTCAILVLSDDTTGILKIIRFLIHHIPEEIIAMDRSFDIPKNGLINGTSHLGIARTSLPNLTFKILSYSGHTKLINLKVDFPVVKHSGIYHNNVTVLSNAKHVEDTTNITIDLSSVSFTIQSNINSSRVWNLKANVTAKGNVKLSGFLNDDKISEDLSKYLTKNLSNILHTHQTDISRFISPILEKEINILYHQ